MARQMIYVSDLSGDTIDEGKGATVTIKFSDARKGTIVLDVTDAEGEELGKKGRHQKRRGRRRSEGPGLSGEEKRDFRQ
jgi:hypothetical protein